MWDTQAIIERLVERFPTIEVHNEICRATQERQEAAVIAADDVECVVVVGSARSSNSQRLVQVVREKGHKPAYLVDTAADIDPSVVQGDAPDRRHVGRVDADADHPRASSRPWRRCPKQPEVTFRLQRSQTRFACYCRPSGASDDLRRAAPTARSRRGRGADRTRRRRRTFRRLRLRIRSHVLRRARRRRDLRRASAMQVSGFAFVAADHRQHHHRRADPDHLLR